MAFSRFCFWASSEAMISRSFLASASRSMPRRSSRTAAGICFFSGGTCGVCGYAYGGWRGALLGSFLVGIVLCAGPLVLYPAFANLGIAGASFPNVDYNIVGSIIYGIGSIFA